MSGDVSRRLARDEGMAGIKSFYKLSKIANIVQEMPGLMRWAFEIASDNLFMTIR